jgi:predicted RNA methylase
MLGSSTSLGIKDAYFTSPSAVDAGLTTLSRFFDLRGKTALEPSCGSGVFIRESTKWGLKWTTNELFPEYSQGFKADFNLDFGKADLKSLGRFDFCIGNPPFGKSTTLARKFVLRALEISNVVAMVLPFGCRRITFIDKLPRDVRILVDEEIKDDGFELPNGAKKKVKCTWMVFAHEPGYQRPLELDLDNSVFRWELGGSKPPNWATHGLGLWSNAGTLFEVRSESFQRGAGSTMWLNLNKKEAERFFDFEMAEIIAKTSTSFPRIAWREGVTYLNRFFKAG